MTKKEDFEIKGWTDGKIVKLLPCAFCGGEPELLHIGNDYKPKKRITIKCKKCRVERTDAALHHDFNWLEDVAQKGWNDRSWIENEIREARIKQLEDAKAFTESKLGSGYNSFTEEVLIEMARQYQHLISELEKEKK